MESVDGRHPKASKFALEEQDVISNMPDNVISNILDRLPIRDAVRTGILSRDWRFKWNMLTQLVFKPYPSKKWYSGKDISKLLLQLKGTVTKFVLYLLRPDFVYEVEDISLWILFLSRKGIKEFTLINLMSRAPLKLPTHLFSCLELKYLKLYQCDFCPPPSFRGFPNLSSLGLKYMRFEGASVGDFINWCPILEILKFDDNDVANKMKPAEIAKFRNLKTLAFPLCMLDNIAITSFSIFQLFGFLPKVQNLELDFSSCKIEAEAGARNRLPTAFLSLKTLTLSEINISNGIMLSCGFDIICGCSNLQTLKITARNVFDQPPGISSSVVDYNSMGQFQLRNVVFEGFIDTEDEVKKYIDEYTASSLIGFSIEDLKLVEEIYAEAVNWSASLQNVTSSAALKKQIDMYSNFLSVVAGLARTKFTEFNLRMMGIGFGILLTSISIPLLVIRKVNDVYIEFPSHETSNYSFGLFVSCTIVAARACSFLSTVTYTVEEGKMTIFFLTSIGMLGLRHSIRIKKMISEAGAFVFLIYILRIINELGLSKQGSHEVVEPYSWMYVAELAPILPLIILAYLMYKVIACSSCNCLLKFILIGSIFSYILVALHWTLESSLSAPLIFDGLKGNVIPRIIYIFGIAQLFSLAVLQFFQKVKSSKWGETTVLKAVAMLSVWSSTLIILSRKQGPFIALASVIGGWLISRLKGLDQDDKTGLLALYSSPVTQWGLLAACLFFCTGHSARCAFDGLRYAAAFIGFDEFTVIPQAILLTVETYGFSHILPTLGLPFLVASRYSSNEAKSTSSKWAMAMLSVWSSTLIILSGKQGPFIALASVIGGWLISRLKGLDQDDKTGLLALYSSPVTQWSLLASCLLFCTGHWCAFDGLRYAAAFIGFDEFTVIPQAILLTVETYGFSHILPTLGLPFLVVSRYSSNEAKSTRLSLIQLFQVYLIYGLIMTVTTTFTVLCVIIQRRHLMVWGLFAPKFVFDVVGLILTDVLICVSSLFYFV